MEIRPVNIKSSSPPPACPALAGAGVATQHIPAAGQPVATLSNTPLRNFAHVPYREISSCNLSFKNYTSDDLYRLEQKLDSLQSSMDRNDLNSFYKSLPKERPMPMPIGVPPYAMGGIFPPLGGMYGMPIGMGMPPMGMPMPRIGSQPPMDTFGPGRY